MEKLSKQLEQERLRNSDQARAESGTKADLAEALGEAEALREQLKVEP